MCSMKTKTSRTQRQSFAVAPKALHASHAVRRLSVGGQGHWTTAHGQPEAVQVADDYARLQCGASGVQYVHLGVGKYFFSLKFLYS